MSRVIISQSYSEKRQLAFYCIIGLSPRTEGNNLARGTLFSVPAFQRAEAPEQGNFRLVAKVSKAFDTYQ